MTEEMHADRDHDQLVPYLLGTLPDDLRQQIDDRILSDEGLFESLRATENELVYDYALSLLGPEERAQFETRFPANTAIRQKVANARDLLKRVRGIDGRAQPRSTSRWMLWMPLAAAATTVLVVGWLVSENVRLRDRLASSNRLARAAVQRAAESERVAQDARARSDATAQPTLVRPAATAASSPLILSMVLEPGVLGSDSRTQRIRIVEAAAALRLQLSLPASVPRYSSYRVSIRTPDDVTAWSGNVPADQRDGNTVSVVVPAGALPGNDYELFLSGQSAPGAVQEITSYPFSVLR